MSAKKSITLTQEQCEYLRGAIHDAFVRGFSYHRRISPADGTALDENDVIILSEKNAAKHADTIYIGAVKHQFPNPDYRDPAEAACP